MKDARQVDVGHLTIQEAANLLGIHRSELYLAIKEGGWSPPASWGALRCAGRTWKSTNHALTGIAAIPNSSSGC